MKTYEVIAREGVTLRAGTLRLSEAQAAARGHALRRLGKDTFTVLAPVAFKRGEVFGYDGVGNKAVLQDLTPASERPAGRAKPVPKAKAAGETPPAPAEPAAES